MRFVHIADMHLDTPFTLLSDRANLGEVRRLDQRKAFKKMVEYIKQNKIPYLFIAGDLYEHEYIRESTIDFINDCFKEIPETKVFITPGNHDPYLKNSYYAKYEWNENVKIFKEEVEKIEFEDFCLYGYGFEDFYMRESKINEIEIENKDKINILITHGDLDSGKDDYNTIFNNQLKQLDFDYVALGHIHKTKLTDNIIYPGSTICLGFDELGKHGMVVGNLEKGKLDLEFIELDEKEFKEIEVDVTDITNIEDLLEKIEGLNIKENELYKLILMGNRNIEINIYKLYKMIDIRNVIKIKNQTKMGYNLEKIANDTTLKGIFIKEMLNKLEDADADKEMIEKAIEIGLDSLS